MTKRKMVVLFVLLAVCALGAPVLKPVVNQGVPVFFFFFCFSSFLPSCPTEINYALAGTVDSKGRNGALMSEASIGSLQGVFATKCLGTNGTMAVFVCNMFDVAVSVSQGADKSEVVRTSLTGRFVLTRALGPQKADQVVG
jgi:hypothetical protein